MAPSLSAESRTSTRPPPVATSAQSLVPDAMLFRQVLPGSAKPVTSPPSRRTVGIEHAV